MLWEMPRDLAAFQPVAIDLARKATTLRPEIVETWERLAWRLLGTEEFEEAIVVLAEAIARFPKEPRLYLMLADTYHRAQRLDLARKLLERTPTIPIDDRKTTVYRLELLMKTKNAEDPLQVAVDTLTLDPTNITALRSLANIARKSGNYELMTSICQAALEHDPGHTAARYELAVAYTILRAT